MLVALVADQTMKPLAREFMTPLDEGMVMDMPITVPRASVTESVDDLKARDMVLCRFPEVDMVVGKAGRAETPTDPAPMDMIETMVNFRPREFWPRRKLRAADAMRQGRAVFDALVARGVDPARRDGGRARRADRAGGGGRLAALRRGQPRVCLPSEPGDAPRHGRDLADLDQPHRSRGSPARAALARHVEQLDGELLDAGRAGLHPARDGAAPRPRDDHRPGRRGSSRSSAAQVRAAGVAAATRHARRRPPASHHHGGCAAGLEPAARAAARCSTRSRTSCRDRFSRRLLLWKVDRDELAAFGGELDTAVQMPGWTNVWTMPIQNRVDMLATGVNTPIGIRVLGRNLDDVVRGSEEVARVVKRIAGRGRRRRRPDPGQALYRDPPRPRPGRPAGRERRRGQRRDRDGPGRQGGHVDRRGPRAASRRRPLRPAPGAKTKSRSGTSW